MEFEEIKCENLSSENSKLIDELNKLKNVNATMSQKITSISKELTIKSDDFLTFQKKYNLNFTKLQDNLKYKDLQIKRLSEELADHEKLISDYKNKGATISQMETQIFSLKTKEQADKEDTENVKIIQLEKEKQILVETINSINSLYVKLIPIINTC